MRKLVSKKKNKQRFYQILFGLILVFIMFSSVIGYSFMNKRGENEEKTRVYNGLEFTNMNNYWVAELEGYEFAFKHHPEDVPSIEAELNMIEAYYNKPLYIQSDEQMASSEIYNNLYHLNGFVERIQGACLDKGNETSCKGDLPVINCSRNLIIIQAPDSESSNIINISQVDNCVFINAPKSELVKVTDEFLFKILGID